ncbi:phosphotriesterase family protein [Rhodococcus opacus]|uniref:N-acylhomoserine lactonase n=1 Tax=Rhodococcus opacus (strain B4) TaxID=632772 RepID=C1AW37_RHOOB|nr:phosphotriesterase [Rhodococcus opacus]BAH49467.1 N-acylhomoserine lactonase [Rhodococcus opacus B4]
MSQVNTVRGPSDSAELGRTYMHDAVAKLRALARQGVRTIVDPTVVGLGRYIPNIQRVAEHLPELNIVAATGLYTYDDVPFFFHYRGPALDAIVGAAVPDPMVDMFVKDIEEGIADTGVRAGLLECAIDRQGLTRGVERVMRTVAKAHRRTGVPITVHTHPGSEAGLHVKRVMCDEEGVRPDRIVLGHSGDSTDVEHLTGLAEEGFVLGMDRFGINLETTSQDASCYIDWIDLNLMAALPQWHHLHIEKDVLPYVRERGVTEKMITEMLVEVPRRYFENVEPY